MRLFFQRPGVRRIWILFRWFRICLWLILFLGVAAVSYLHLVGLPDFLKRPLLRRLLAEGVAAQFANMQLGWGRGPSIVIEDARSEGTRLNSSHVRISYAVFCLKKKKNKQERDYFKKQYNKVIISSIYTKYY